MNEKSQLTVNLRKNSKRDFGVRTNGQRRTNSQTRKPYQSHTHQFTLRRTNSQTRKPYQSPTNAFTGERMLKKRNSYVPFRKENAALESAAAAASDVTTAMMAVKIELEEKKRTNDLLQRALVSHPFNP